MVAAEAADNVNELAAEAADNVDELEMDSVGSAAPWFLTGWAE